MSICQSRLPVEKNSIGEVFMHTGDQLNEGRGRQSTTNNNDELKLRIMIINSLDLGGYL